eukprot:241981-Chlamydomonas_euryale.AAC.7
MCLAALCARAHAPCVVPCRYASAPMHRQLRILLESSYASFPSLLPYLCPSGSNTTSPTEALAAFSFFLLTWFTARRSSSPAIRCSAAKASNSRYFMLVLCATSAGRAPVLRAARRRVLGRVRSFGRLPSQVWGEKAARNAHPSWQCAPRIRLAHLSLSIHTRHNSNATKGGTDGADLHSSTHPPRVPSAFLRPLLTCARPAPPPPALPLPRRPLTRAPSPPHRRNFRASPRPARSCQDPHLSAARSARRPLKRSP